MIVRRILPIFILALLCSCSSKSAVVAPTDFDPERSFEKANVLLDSGDYEEARSLFLEVRNRDLTKKYSSSAQLRIADSYVKEGETEQAISEYNRFLEFFPDHRFSSYAQYQIAMVYYNQIESPERGYGWAEKALKEFEKLKQNFPRNPYREIVDLRIEKCRNIMADYEFLVGSFYLKKDAYSAAITRFEFLLSEFPDYKKLSAVFLNLGVAYKGNGQPEVAEKYFDRVVKDFPDSEEAKEANKELARLHPEDKKTK